MDSQASRTVPRRANESESSDKQLPPPHPEEDSDHDHTDEDTSSSPPHPIMGPIRSVGGWVVFVTGLHPETSEDDVRDTFADHGQVTAVKMNSDRRTGHAKGHALVEFAQKLQAQDAINNLHGKEFMGNTIFVDWAFVQSTLSL